MAESAQEGLTIPGYQPVEKLGNSPSYGIWVRAVQTRMDRHVLLKLLPPGLPSNHEFFAREIAALVKRDGHGVLRVIHEGEAAGVRYLVVDEGEGVPLTELPEGLSTEEWFRLGSTLEGLYRWAGERGEVLLPIPLSALLRQPTGDFCVADLGWLVPVGERVPSGPLVPGELVASRAQAWMNGCFLGCALRSAAYGLETSPPREWLRIVSDLDSLRGPPGESDPLAEPLFEWTETETRTVPGAVLLVFGALLVATVAWVTSQILQRDELAPDPPEAVATGVPDLGPGTEDVNGGEITPPPPPPPPSSDPEQPADQALAAIRGDAGVGVDRVSFDDGQEARLHGLIEEYPGTGAAGRAKELLSRLEGSRKLWEKRRPDIARALDAGDLIHADASLREARAACAAMPAGVAEDMQQLEERIDERCAARLEALVRATASDRAESRFEAALEQVDAAIPVCPESRRAGLRELGQEINAEQKLRAGLLGVLAATRDGRWDEAEHKLWEVAPPGTYQELVRSHVAWTEHFAAAREIFTTLRDGLVALQKGRRFRTFELERPVETPQPRGRVEAVAAETFFIKLQGLVRGRGRDLPYRRLSLGAAEKLARDGGGRLTAGQWPLLLVFLGDSGRALELVEGARQRPGWYPSVVRVHEDMRRANLADLLARGRGAAAQGDFESARDHVLELKESFSADELAPHRDELLAWLEGFYGKRGPAAAFPGASFVEASDGLLKLGYDFTDRRPALDWRPLDEDGDHLVTRHKDRLSVRGSACLLPEGAPSGRIFESALEVNAELRARDGKAPNLNLVLWSQFPASTSAGLIFGLGCKPEGLSSLEAPSKPQRLLPANLIGPLAAVEGGDYEAPVWFEIEPKVRVDRWISVSARSDAKGVVLTWKRPRSATVERPNFLPDPEPEGTVELRSYGSRIDCRRIEIRGRLRAEWWQGWIRARALRELEAG